MVCNVQSISAFFVSFLLTNLFIHEELDGVLEDGVGGGGLFITLLLLSHVSRSLIDVEEQPGLTNAKPCIWSEDVTSTAFMCFLLFACDVKPLSPIEDISISFKHERQKALCGSFSGLTHLYFATQHCWNEHFLPVLPIFNDYHTKHEVPYGRSHY